MAIWKEVAGLVVPDLERARCCRSQKPRAPAEQRRPQGQSGVLLSDWALASQSLCESLSPQGTGSVGTT